MFPKCPDFPAVGTDGPGSAEEGRPPAPSARLSPASSAGWTRTGPAGPGEGPLHADAGWRRGAYLTVPGRAGQPGRCQVFIFLGLLPCLPGVRVQPVQRKIT